MDQSNKADISQKEFYPSSSTFCDESPRKCNLPFSFNFYLDEVNNDDSSDSETTNLQIDVSEINNHESPSKHKRDTIEETSSVINEMEEEIERQLDAKAAKTNLTVTNVKNILKHVITNEHVMAMVQKRLCDTEDDIYFEPKLTRAKAKELAAAQVNIPWPIAPLKKSTSEVQVLIEEELPEDSSDEEYNPEQDKHSDDDRETENVTNIDVDSPLSSQINNCDTCSDENSKLSNIQYDPEGIFKIPSVPHVPTEEESIGQRTRSKLCLSETSLEQIEQSFIPPDITTDMYDWDCEIDEDWDNFLKAFTQPLTQEPITEDDTEADPEYNITEDEETDFLDKEELRADKAVKVTRKELNNLIAELFEFTDTFSKQEQEFSKKKKCLDNSNLLTTSNSLSCSIANLIPVWTEPELPTLVSPEQRHLLTVQLSQHIQLMAQHFVMTFMHPELHFQSKICKQNLNSMRYLSSGPNSAFNAINLSEALKLVSDWEKKFLDTEFCKDFKKSMADEDIIKKIYSANKWKHIPVFHPELKKLFVESKALMYPQLLPEIPFRNECNKYLRCPYLKSEEKLVALGLEQFLPFIASKPRKFKTKKSQLMDAIQLIIQYLVPCRELQRLFCHIQKRRWAKDANPIKHYFEKGCAPRTIHCITLDYALMAPKEQPINLLPLKWQTYLNNTEQKIDQLKRKHILNSYNDVMKSSRNLDQKNKTASISNDESAHNSAINIVPKVSLANVTYKNSYKNFFKNNSGTCEHVNNTDARSTSWHSEHERLKTRTECGVDSNTSNFEAVEKEFAAPESEPLKNSMAMEDEKEEKRIATSISSKQSKNDILISTIATKNSKFSKKSPVIIQESPQLRKTTPRLAKTRSAQNMKLVAQVLGSKCLSSNCSSLKSKEKHELSKGLEKPSMLSKIDNEEEIAELMLASTTIRKDSISRKKAKEVREMENIRRLLESENPLNEEERGSKFAASYLQKLHLTLESTNPETFKAVIKLYLDYCEKVDNITQVESELSFSDTSGPSPDKEAIEKMVKDKNAIAIDLYRDVCEKLEKYPELCTDFLLFLKPHQAAMINKSIDYMMLQKMNEFINVAQIYFAKQPSRIAKMMQAITQLSSNPHTTLENVHSIMSTLLKGHPLVMDLFLQILPTAKPPESLFASHMFENLICPLGPHDKNKIYTEDAIELCEYIELPVLSFQEDPYGGDNCRCNCHNDMTLRNISEHCISCGIRYLNGRIYLQTSEGLRPAKIIFPGADEEKLTNIARVSLKMTDKFRPTPTKQRRKSSKNESNHDELYQKLCASKNSPFKNNVDTERAIIKPKKVLPSLKSDEQKRTLKRLRTIDQLDENNKKICVAESRNKREKKNEKQKLSGDYRDLTIVNYKKSNNKLECTNSEVSNEILNKGASDTKSEISHTYLSVKKIDFCDINEENLDLKSAVKDCKPWTREEDMILLQNVKKEYSENSFAVVSGILGNRSVNQVKERCHTLLSLLEKMV